MIKTNSESNRNPKVSIIVPAYNAAKKIAFCLDSLLQLDFPKEDKEIIVVDNNSTDNTKEIISRYPIEYTFERKRTRGAARNKGISIAKGKYIAFTDSDCIVDKNWLKILLEAIESDDNVVSCGGKIIAYKTDDILEKFAEERNKLNQELAMDSDINLQIPRVVTANAIFLKDALEEIGLFDEDLITSEDTEIGWRMSFYGYQMKYAPEALVYHQHISNLKDFCLHQFEYGCANNLLFRKYRNIIKFSLSNTGYILLRIKWLWRLIINTFKVIAKNKKEKRIYLLLEKLDNMFFVMGELCMFLKPLRLSNRFSSQCLARQQIQIKYNGSNLRLSDGIFWFINNNSLRLFNFRDTLFYKLNETAVDIWRCWIKGKDLSQTINEISGEYGTSAELVKEDMSDFINQLREENILVSF